MDIQSAIVLAAGEGTRLKPLTEHRPKPMLPVAGRPILEYVFDELIEAGITEIAVVVGYRRNRVQSHFGPTYRNVPLTYVTQGKQLGSGHALLAAEAVVEDPFLVINGDQLVDRRIIEAVEVAHRDADATLGLIRHDPVEEYGGVLLEPTADERGRSHSGDGAAERGDSDRSRSADGTQSTGNGDGASDEPSPSGTGDDVHEVAEIVENPRDDRNYLLNAGVYAFGSSIFEAIRSVEPHVGEHALIDGVGELIDAGTTVQGVISDGLWIDATYPWDLLYAADTLLDDGTRVESRISPNARIHESATIVEPVVIREECVVGPGAVVGPGVCLGENVTIGANATVEHSVVDTDTRIDPAATLLDCVTGQGVHVGPGSTVVGGPGDVRVGDRIHRNVTLGAVLADRVRDGGGVTYRPGTVVGHDARIEAGSSVDGIVEPKTEVRS